jgi:hypothetical protein
MAQRSRFLGRTVTGQYDLESPASEWRVEENRAYQSMQYLAWRDLAWLVVFTLPRTAAYLRIQVSIPLTCIRSRLGMKISGCENSRFLKELRDTRHAIPNPAHTHDSCVCAGEGTAPLVSRFGIATLRHC